MQLIFNVCVVVRQKRISDPLELEVVVAVRCGYNQLDSCFLGKKVSILTY